MKRKDKKYLEISYEGLNRGGECGEVGLGRSLRLGGNNKESTNRIRDSCYNVSLMQMK